MDSPAGSPRRGYIEALSQIFERIGAWSYDHRWVVVALSLLVWGVSGYLASTARIDLTWQSFFDEKDPTYSAYQQFRDDFGSDELSYILYEAPGFQHGPFDLGVMRKIDSVTQALEKEVPFVSEVTSLTNVEYMEPIPDGIKIYDLLEEFPGSQKDLLVIRDKVLAKPMYVGGLVSPDAKYAAIIVEMEKACIDSPADLRLDPDAGTALENLYPQVTETAISRILARPELEGIEFYHSGEVPWNATVNRTVVPESLRLMGIGYILIGLLLYLFFRRVMGVIGPFIVVTIALSISAGLVGLLGWSIDLMFPFVPNLLIAVGVADSVHIISEFNTSYAKLGDRREAVRRTMYFVGTPCLLTSLTTGAGLYSMSISHIKSLAHLAVYSAAGILAAFLFSVTLLMTFFTFGRRAPSTKPRPGGSPEEKKERFFDTILSPVSHFAARHPKEIIFVFAAIFVISLAGIGRLRVDSNFLEEWAEEAPIRKTVVKVDEIMGGMSSIIYLFDTGVPEGIKDPAVLREIERLQAEADRQRELVKKSYSIVDVIKDINQTFHDGDPAYHVIPESRNLVAQYLLLYSMSGGDDLDRYVSSDYSRANLELRCKMDAISRTDALVSHLEGYLSSEPLVASRADVTGMGALWLKFADYIADSQIKGILLAFTVIAAMMCFLFRSIKIGLLSMIPNLSPVVLTLGFMGWVGLDLDYTRLLIAPLAIGIAVDDTIHLVTRCHVEFQRCRSYERALRASLLGVGPALIGTTAILVVGFLVYVFHSMPIQIVFGQLVASTVFVALIADLLLMPALILVFRPFGPEGLQG